MPDCANHPGTPALEPCAGCGRPLCERCLLPFAGFAWCDPCKAGPRFADAVAGKLRPPPPPRAPMPLATRLLFVGVFGGLLTICLSSAWFGGGALKGAAGKVQTRIGPEIQRECRGDINKLGVAARRYQRKNGRLPTRAPGESAGDVIRRLAADGLLQPADVPPFVPHVACPGAMLRGYVPIAGTNSGAWIEDASYEGFGGGASLPHEGPIAPLAWDRDLENHGGAGRNVLFENGSVRWIPEAETVTAIDPSTGAVPAPTATIEEAMERYAQQKRELEAKHGSTRTGTGIGVEDRRAEEDR